MTDRPPNQPGQPEGEFTRLIREQKAREDAERRARHAQARSGRPVDTPATVHPIDGARAARAAKYAARALAEEVSTLLGTTEGRRNDQLNVAAFNLGQLISAGHLDRVDVTEQLRAAAEHIGLESGEVEATLRSGLSAGLARPRRLDLGPELEPQVSEVEPEEFAESSVDQSVEADFWLARDLLTHIHRFARARMVAPWAVLGVTLARIVTATDYRIHLPAIVGGRGSLNMFVGLVGRSGSGKGAATAVSIEAVELINEPDSYRIASGEAITHVYKKRGKGSAPPAWIDDSHAALIEVAEIDRLGGQQARQGSTIMADLRSAWSGELLGQIAADRSRSIPLEAHQYRLCLVAGIQPHRAHCLLDDADGGTPQRFVWLPAIDPQAPDELPKEPPPMPVSPPEGVGPMAVCEQARAEIIETRRAHNRGDVDALDAHAMMARLKIAAALGLAEGRMSVTDEDWRLAGVIAQRSEATRNGVVESAKAKARAEQEAASDAAARRAVKVEQTTEEAAIKRACQTIRRKLARESKQGGDWVSGSDLYKSVRPRDVGQPALDRLLETGEIERETSTRGYRYRAIKKVADE